MTNKCGKCGNFFESPTGEPVICTVSYGTLCNECARGLLELAAKVTLLEDKKLFKELAKEKIIVEPRFCLKCGVSIDDKRSDCKYCSSKCRTQYNSLKRYHKIQKFDSAYKLKQKNNLKKWIEKNRLHFNDLVREPNRLRSARLYKERKAAGICVMCGKRPMMHPVVCCRECREKYYWGKNE